MKTECSCGEDCKICVTCDSPMCECFCDLYAEEENQDYSKDYYV